MERQRLAYTGQKLKADVNAAADVLDSLEYNEAVSTERALELGSAAAVCVLAQLGVFNVTPPGEARSRYERGVFELAQAQNVDLSGDGLQMVCNGIDAALMRAEETLEAVVRAEGFDKDATVASHTAGAFVMFTKMRAAFEAVIESKERLVVMAYVRTVASMARYYADEAAELADREGGVPIPPEGASDGRGAEGQPD
jgi:hypothetical protein